MIPFIFPASHVSKAEDDNSTFAYPFYKYLYIIVKLLSDFGQRICCSKKMAALIAFTLFLSHSKELTEGGERHKKWGKKEKERKGKYSNQKCHFRTVWKEIN